MHYFVEKVFRRKFSTKKHKFFILLKWLVIKYLSHINIVNLYAHSPLLNWHFLKIPVRCRYSPVWQTNYLKNCKFALKITSKDLSMIRKRFYFSIFNDTVLCVRESYLFAKGIFEKNLIRICKTNFLQITLSKRINFST